MMENLTEKSSSMRLKKVINYRPSNVFIKYFYERENNKVARKYLLFLWSMKRAERILHELHFFRVTMASTKR
jgi:hypothetical protein